MSKMRAVVSSISMPQKALYQRSTYGPLPAAKPLDLVPVI